MSDLFEKIGAVARQTADTVSIQVAITTEEQKIRKAYQIIGKLYYQAAKRGRAPEGPDFDRAMKRIDESAQKIRDLKFRKDAVPSVDPCDFVEVD